MPSNAFADQELENIRFDFEEYIKREIGIDGDRKPAPDICKFYLRGTCPKGKTCPFKHGRPGERRSQVVCKHWLRGLCKKGDQCEFLHEYNLRRMPECWFYSKYGECCNAEECMYLHINPDSKQVQCPWYDRGFCKHGSNCRLKHIRAALCQLYVNGFCPQGPNCPNGHPKYELPDMDKLDINVARINTDRHPGYFGSAAAAGQGSTYQHTTTHSTGGGQRGDGNIYRPLSEVICFKCGQKGHYANRCSGIHS